MTAYRTSSFLALLLLASSLFLSAAPAQAASCWVSGNPTFTFSDVNLDSLTDTTASLGYVCQSDASTTYFALCLYMADGTPITGVNPRYMTNYNSSTLQFDLYGDAARTQKLGPMGSGLSPLTWSIAVPGGYQQSATPRTIYARIPGGQTSLVAGSNYQSQMPNSTLYYSWSTSAPPTSCTSSNASTLNFYSSATATVPNTCNISAATDMDFGNVGGLATAVNQTSSIMLRCPSGTTWRVGLNNGSHASGSTRRMASGSNYISYELYRDSGRTQRWGTSLGTDTSNGTGSGMTNAITLPVYGRVPAQATTASGTYSDTITVTLTY